LYLAFELLESDLWDYMNKVCKPPEPHMSLRPLPVASIKVSVSQHLFVSSWWSSLFFVNS
jgi:hypothetical protein